MVVVGVGDEDGAEVFVDLGFLEACCYEGFVGCDSAEEDGDV